jgi:hypothetical protein
LTNSVKILNHLDPDGEYLRFYTELDSNFQVGDKVFIIGGNYDNTIYTNKEHSSYDPFHSYAAGYEVLSVDTTMLSNAITLNISYRDAQFTSGGIESFVFDPKPVYKTDEELLLQPNQPRESYISKSYFKRGEFNGGKFQDGIFGEYNTMGDVSGFTYQRNKAVENLKASLIAIVESEESSVAEVEEAVKKLETIATNKATVYNRLESHSQHNQSFFNNNFNNTPAQWTGGVFLGGEWQWGEWKSKYATSQTGKYQQLNANNGIKSLLDTTKYNIKTFNDNNGGIGYNYFVSGNIGKIYEGELYATISQNTLISIEYLPFRVTEALINQFVVELRVNGKVVSFDQNVVNNTSGEKVSVQFVIKDSVAKPNKFSTGKLLSAHWFDGVFENGLIDGGKWHGGLFKSGTIRSNYERAYWLNGVFDGQKDVAFAENLRWLNGEWKNGNWKGDANININAIEYGNDTIILSINSKYMHLFEIGEKVFISYIKRSLQNEYLNSYTDQPLVNLLNMQTFKLLDIVNTDEYHVNLVLEGKADQNLKNINLQYAKVSQSFFKKGTWYDGIWESGLREVKNITVKSFTYAAGVLDLTVNSEDVATLQVGDKIEVTNLQETQQHIVGVNRDPVRVNTSLDKSYEISAIVNNTVSINIGTEAVSISTINAEVGITQIATALWHNGEFRSGVWDGGVWKSNTSESSVFRNYLYFDTQNTQIQSIWKSGYWKGGKFNNGVFLSGIWQNGIWQNGIMSNLQGESVWLNGEWRNGTLNRGLFLNGKMLNGTVINGGISNIDWKAGSYSNGLSLFNNTSNNNRSGRYLTERNEYDSLSAPSMLYIDGNGWVQLDQPSFYQRKYGVIFQDLGFYGEYDNPFQNEMFTIKETQDYGTRIRIDNGKTGEPANPLTGKKLPIVSVGNIVGASELNEQEIIFADSQHKRLMKINTTTGDVKVYGKILYGKHNHAFEFNNIKNIFTADNSANIYVVDGKELKVIYNDGAIDVMFAIAPTLLSNEEILDIWVAPSLSNIGETVFLLTNLGKIHYWVNEVAAPQRAFQQVSVINTGSTYTLHNFSGARSDSAKTHFILNCSTDGISELRHVVMDYSNANNAYDITTYANNSDLDTKDDLVACVVKNVAIKLESSEIKIWILADDLTANQQKVFLKSYKKYFLSSASNGVAKSGVISGKRINQIRLGYGATQLLIVEKAHGLNTKGEANTEAFNVKIGNLATDVTKPAYAITTKFSGYKVVKPIQTNDTKELSPYVTGRVLYNTKINQAVSFNPNGSIFSAHVVSACWNNGLFVGSWDAPTYVDHAVLEKKSIFVDGVFEGVFHDGFFLGGTFRDRASATSILKQGHFLSDANDVNWLSGTITSDIRYDIDSIRLEGNQLMVSVETLDNSLQPIPFSKLNKGAVVQIPALFRKQELAVYAVERGDINVIDDYDEIILKVDKPSIYAEGYWRGSEIFISSSEFAQDLFGYQYVTHVSVDGAYMYLTIRNKFTSFSNGSNTYVFKNKPKVLVGQYLKVDAVTVDSEVDNKAVVKFNMPLPEGSTLEDFRKYYILDSIDVVAYNNGHQVLIPDYLQVFPFTFNKTFKHMSLTFNSTAKNMYFNNIIDDNNTSIVMVDTSASGNVAYNIMVNNSYVTSSKATDWIGESVFLSGKTDRKWNSGLWLNLDERGFSNGNSVFAGTDTTRFVGSPMDILGYEVVDDGEIEIRVNGDAVNEFGGYRYITLRGFTGKKANILGGTRSKAFKIQSILGDVIRIKNPFIYYADYNRATINTLLQPDTETMKVKTATNGYIGVETASEDVVFKYAKASRSAWNGGEFTGTFDAVWNAGSFLNGNFNSSAAWYGSHESYYWAGNVEVESGDNESGYVLSIDVTDTSCLASELVYVKFNKNFINNRLLKVYDDFYAVVTVENGRRYIKNISSTLLPDTQVNGVGEEVKMKYGVQIVRYKQNYTTTNNLLVDYEKVNVIPEQFTVTSKSVEVPRVSLFLGGDFTNAVWHNGIFIGGRLLPLQQSKTIWKYGIKHNGHLGGTSYVDITKHIHWLGGFHESDNNAELSSVKNIVWYRGSFNGGAWINGNWHSLNLSNNYINDTWSTWQKGEWYSKGRSLVVTAIITTGSISGEWKGTKTVMNGEGYDLNIGDTVFSYNQSGEVNGLYTVTSGTWTKATQSHNGYVINVQKGNINGGKLFYVNGTSLVELNNGNTVNNTNYTMFNESIWHGGTWSSAVVDSKVYTYESTEYKIYGLRNNTQAEYPKASSIWLGGAWLRGVWNGGVFANGTWHSVNTTVATEADSIYEKGVKYKYDNTRSTWNAGMMVNSVWNGGTVSASVDPLDVVFGDITNYDYIAVDGDFKSLPTFKFKRNDNFSTTILGKKVFDKNAYNVTNADKRIYLQDSADSILPVYWRRGVWNGGLMQFSYWQNLNLENTDTNTISKEAVDNWSFFERGCFYSAYWEGGLMKANASLNSAAFESQGYLDGLTPSTIFYRSQWEKGYWQAVGINRTPESANVVDKTTQITDALFSRSIWNAGVFEGGLFDLSVWRSGTKAATQIKYNGGVVTTNAATIVDQNPFYVINETVTNANPLTTDIGGVKNDASFFTSLTGVRYVGAIDNFASIWVNGMMRGSIWHGGIWQRGMFRHREFGIDDKMNFFDQPKTDTEPAQIGVWTRGAWLSGYFSYFNDMAMLRSLNNSHFDPEHGKRSVFMGMKAHTFTNATYDRSNIFGGNISYVSILGSNTALEQEHNKASVFSRRMVRETGAETHRYFSIFNGTMVNGTILSRVAGTTAFEKMIISPYATVSKYGYIFDNTTRNIGELTNIPYGSEGKKLYDIVEKTFMVKSDGTQFTIPYLPTATPVYCVGGSNTLERVPEASNFLYHIFNGHFQNASGTNNSVWRHNHSYVGDGNTITVSKKSIEQGTGMKWHYDNANPNHNDVLGGEPNYTNDGLDAYENEDGIQSIIQP